MTQESSNNLEKALEQLDLMGVVALQGLLNQRALFLLMQDENKKLAIRKAPLTKPKSTLVLPT